MTEKSSQKKHDMTLKKSLHAESIIHSLIKLILIFNKYRILEYGSMIYSHYNSRYWALPTVILWYWDIKSILSVIFHCTDPSWIITVEFYINFLSLHLVWVRVSEFWILIEQKGKITELEKGLTIYSYSGNYFEGASKTSENVNFYKAYHWNESSKDSWS